MSTGKESYPLIKLNNGQLIPAIGLGTWTMNDTQARQAVSDAVSVGYRHVDTAWRYLNEKGVGQGLQDVFNTTTVKREDMFVTSKVWNTFHGRNLTVEAIKESLNNLGLDYLDLALIHWPTGFKSGTGDMYPKYPNGSIIPSDESFIDAWKGMEDLYNQGLAKSIGISNFNIKQLKSLLKSSSVKPAVNQFENHPFLVQQDLVDFCQANNIAVIAYSPLRQADKELLENPILLEIAKKYKKSVAQVTLRWNIQRNVIVIPKSTRVHRMAENIDIFDFKLTEQDMTRISSLNSNKRVIDIPGIQSHPDYPFNFYIE